MSNQKNRVALVLSAIVLVSLAVGLYQRKSQYNQFVEFKQDESGTVIEKTVKSSQVKVAVNKIPSIHFVSDTGESYNLVISGLKEGQIKQLEQFDFTGSSLSYFNHGSKRCLLAVIQKGKMVIQGETSSSDLKPFSFFGIYNFYCDSI